MYKVRLTYFVKEPLRRKIAETASDKPPHGKLVTTESIQCVIKKVLGLILNLLNDTN
ncbi:hypothetical protein CRH02_11420 [Escherichia albertii]|nr:hypothetical protein CRH02_11420 [Escherichia albertii]